MRARELGGKTPGAGAFRIKNGVAGIAANGCSNHSLSGIKTAVILARSRGTLADHIAGVLTFQSIQIKKLIIVEAPTGHYKDDIEKTLSSVKADLLVTQDYVMGKKVLFDIFSAADKAKAAGRIKYTCVFSDNKSNEGRADIVLGYNENFNKALERFNCANPRLTAAIDKTQKTGKLELLSFESEEKGPSRPRGKEGEYFTTSIEIDRAMKESGDKEKSQAVSTFDTDKEDQLALQVRIGGILKRIHREKD
jgi:hypothetical protein